MARLTNDDLVALHRASSMQFCGGALPYTYGQYLRYEKLRRRGLLRFFNRRNSRWDLNCYVTTPLGHTTLEAI